MSFKQDLVNTANGARNSIKSSAIRKFVDDLKKNMMYFAERGQDFGSFSLECHSKPLGDILGTTDVDSWLLKQALETEDFEGINIHISSDRLRVCFSWK